MQTRQLIPLLLSALVLSACSSSSNSPRAVPAPPATNNNGTPVNAIITARFDPSNGVLPLPNNLLLSGSTDLTLNPPVADPTNIGDPFVALSALDGWGLITPWSASFSAALAPATIIPGQTVRMFEVNRSNAGAVTGVVRELQPGVDFTAVLSSVDPTNRTLVMVPLQPLEELKTYMAVLTDGLTDTAGNDVTPDQTYFLAKRTAPLVDAAGNSTDPLLPTATARALEPLRQLTNAQEASAAAAGVNRDDIVLSWAATTQGATIPLRALRSTVQPATTRLAPTGLTTAAAGLPPIADIYIGTIDLPYYLAAPGGAAELPPQTILGTFWQAAPGAYVPPFNSLGLSPTSTNVTFANPLPVAKGTETAPLIMTVPNAASGRTRPEAGWPVVIFGHGITRNRCDSLAISATMAAQGFAVVAMDHPLHGANPDVPSDACGAFYVEGTPFAPIARERTFDVDLINNATGAPGPDGLRDPSGAHFINLASLLTARDNLRQAQADLSVLTLSVPSMDLNANGIGDFDGSRIYYVGQSLGGIIGTVFMTVEPNVSTGVLNVPGGGIAKLLDGSPTFGPRIRAGLAAAAGLQPGTPDFESFLLAAQTVIDSADPINYARSLVLTDRVLLQEVLGDQVVPNRVTGAPLSGTEPLIAIMGLNKITGTALDANGIRGFVRFTEGDHGSLLSPAASAATTFEMQGQMASMLVSGGTSVLVSNDAVIETP
ncbi:MAG: hypothetical protein KDI37_10875 [Xanthomonadales bacterium]|nr:hypothetical protein [Xanthomonadales bacterium]MCB1633747.1 hypothetical protein [Xanthomonadales bacterium]MCB1642226.1 hypothetical protein [Xanthomonadales bacterium]